MSIQLFLIDLPINNFLSESTYQGNKINILDKILKAKNKKENFSLGSNCVRKRKDDIIIEC